MTLLNQRVMGLNPGKGEKFFYVNKNFSSFFLSERFDFKFFYSKKFYLKSFEENDFFSAETAVEFFCIWFEPFLKIHVLQKYFWMFLKTCQRYVPLVHFNCRIHPLRFNVVKWKLRKLIFQAQFLLRNAHIVLIYILEHRLRSTYWTWRFKSNLPLQTTNTKR